MKNFKYIVVLCLFLVNVSAFAQKTAIGNQDYNNDAIEMADVMRSEGKIYVLLAIILVIFAGFIFYLFKTEQKLKKLEKEIKIQ